VENSNSLKTKLAKLSKKVLRKREKIRRALKKKGLPKKKFKQRTRKQSQFAIATSTAKKFFMG